MTKLIICSLLPLVFTMGHVAPGATPAFIQGAAFLDTSFEATSVSVTFPAAPTPGNAIIVGCMGDGGSKTLAAGGVTDNQANTYTQVAFRNYVGSGQPTALYIATNIAAAGTFTVTCSGVDQVDAIDIFAVEYSGLATTNVLDGTSTGVAQSDAYPRTCGYINTSSPNGLIVALFNNDSAESPAGIRPNGNYILLDCAGGSDGKCAAQDGSRYQSGAMIAAVSGPAGTYSPGFASGPTGNGSQSICVAAAFKAAAD
jgi:hypothetical protein